MALGPVTIDNAAISHSNIPRQQPLAPLSAKAEVIIATTLFIVI